MSDKLHVLAARAARMGVPWDAFWELTPAEFADIARDFAEEIHARELVPLSHILAGLANVRLALVNPRGQPVKAEDIVKPISQRPTTDEELENKLVTVFALYHGMPLKREPKSAT